MKPLICKHCGSECVNGAKVEESTIKAIKGIAPLASEYVQVCPKCYPEKVPSESSV